MTDFVSLAPSPPLPPLSSSLTSLRRLHAVDIFGGGFLPHQDHVLAEVGHRLGVVGREHHLARGGSRGRRQSLADQRLLVRVEECGDQVRSNASQRTEAVLIALTDQK